MKRKLTEEERRVWDFWVWDLGIKPLSEDEKTKNEVKNIVRPTKEDDEWTSSQKWNESDIS